MVAIRKIHVFIRMIYRRKTRHFIYAYDVLTASPSEKFEVTEGAQTEKQNRLDGYYIKNNLASTVSEYLLSA